MLFSRSHSIKPPTKYKYWCSKWGKEKAVDILGDGVSLRYKEFEPCITTLVETWYNDKTLFIFCTHTPPRKINDISIETHEYRQKLRDHGKQKMVGKLKWNALRDKKWASVNCGAFLTITWIKLRSSTIILNMWWGHTISSRSNVTQLCACLTQF